MKNLKEELQELKNKQMKELKELNEKQKTLRKLELRESWELEDKMQERHLEEQLDLLGLN